MDWIDEIDLDNIPKGATHVLKFYEGGPCRWRRAVIGGTMGLLEDGEWVAGAYSTVEWLARWGDEAVELAPLLEEHNFWKEAPEGAMYHSQECGGFYIHEDKEQYYYKGIWQKLIDPVTTLAYFQGVGLRVRGGKPQIKAKEPEKVVVKKQVGWWGTD